MKPVVSDYEHQLRKAASKPVPQHGEQPQHEYTITSEDYYRVEFLKDASITQEQLNNENLARDQKFVPQWPYELGKPLVWPSELEALPTQMRQFHDWYMAVSSKGTIVLPPVSKTTTTATAITGFGWPSRINLRSIEKMRRCKGAIEKKIINSGFIDPEIVNKECIDRDKEGRIYQSFKGMIKNQRSKEFFLLPYRICYKQPIGNNHCGYYVCEAMHIFVGTQSERSVPPGRETNGSPRTLMAFILNEIGSKNGEFYCPPNLAAE
ncbi:hypothetical protein U9M48_043532 [Paspalum notatum var. saurae]|uniref:Ubiquitin-like protease family profile domain-containing protein n=1 Tax=Paspalum notatum var. saurae TaxID=547442 RepID=A0AAQ3UZF1_PASNO